jgi:hypothetical protein
MTSGYVTDSVRHRQDAKTESKRHTEQADADIRKCARQYRAATPAEHKPKRSEGFCSCPLVETKLTHNALLITAILGA